MARRFLRPTLPPLAGVGNPARGSYAGLAGKAFAKVLSETWTEVSPTGAYWNHTRLLSDNRIAAGASDASSCTFEVPQQGILAVKVELIYRRAFKGLADLKGWTDPNLVMASRRFTLRRRDRLSPTLPE
jgi:hypothetical protein